MSEPIGLTTNCRSRERLVRVRRVAEVARRQGGVISRAQLFDCGVTNADIARWVAEGRLHRLHPTVYCLGHKAIGLRGRLVAALLYAGADAAFSHQTASYLWKFTPTRPSQLHVTTPRDRASINGVTVHRAAVEVTRRDDYPVTTVERTLLDLAATLPYADLRRALAEADFQNLLDPPSLLAHLGRGRRGSKPLRAALLAHLPELADAASRLEEEFLLLCERHGIPIPEVNVHIEGFKVDCLWRTERVVVELDSRLAHAQPAKVERDRHRDLVLRRAGYDVRRYTWRQIMREPATVIADLDAVNGLT